MKRWLRREIEDTKVDVAEIKETRKAQRDLLHEVADVVVNLQCAAERLQKALEEYIEKYDLEGDHGSGT